MRLGRKVPVLVDLKPSGLHYMEHLHEAGGLSAVLRELRPLLHLDAPTVSGKTLGEVIAAAESVPAQQVVRRVDNPIHPGGAIAVLRGNLAPGGAVIKHASATRGAAFASRPRCRVRFARRSRSPDRRRRPRRRGRRRAGAAQRRAARRAGHAGGRLHPDSVEARAAGRQGHGAHLRCADERHCLRHDRIARHARSRGRRTARAGRNRRHDRARRRAAPTRAMRRSRRARAASRTAARAQGKRRQRPAIDVFMSSTCCRPMPVAISTSCVPTR